MRSVRYKVYIDYEKEEKWLNTLAAKGLAMVSHAGLLRYEFEDTLPGEYIYRLELMDHLPASAEGRRYIGFLEESGVEMVGGYMRWVYLRKKAADGPFELFSDIDSKIRHLRRQFTLLVAVWPANLLLGITNVLVRPLHEGVPALLLPNFWIGLLNLGIAMLIGVRLFILWSKISGLKKEKQWRE